MALAQRFSIGNSIAENAAAGRPAFSHFHFDLAFVRLELNTASLKIQPAIMPSALGGAVLRATTGRIDGRNSLRSGTLVFTTGRIRYQDDLQGSTTGNGFIMVDTLSARSYNRIFAHEMVHTMQFQELSPLNYWFLKPASRWTEKRKLIKSASRWIYPDLNYELMLLRYFLIEGGVNKNYRTNFLENEAEFLTVGLPANR